MTDPAEWKAMPEWMDIVGPFDGKPVVLKLMSGITIEARFKRQDLVFTDCGNVSVIQKEWAPLDGSTLPDHDPPIMWRSTV